MQVSADERVDSWGGPRKGDVSRWLLSWLPRAAALWPVQACNVRSPHILVCLFLFPFEPMSSHMLGPLVDGLWQPIRSYEKKFLLSTTNTSCNAEIAIWYGRMFPHQIRSSISIIIPLLVKSTYFIRIPFLYLSQKLNKTETVNFYQNNTELVNH